MNTKKIILSMWPILFLGLLLTILFWQVIFQGYVFIDGDNFHLNTPLKYLLVDAVKYHFFPFWNPYILGGIPYAADLNLGTFNPLNFLYFIFPVPRALTLQTILDLLLLGCFQYLFLKADKLRTSASLFGVILLVFSGSIFVLTSNTTIVNTIIFIPLLFYIASKLLQTKKSYFFTSLIFVQLLQITAGHPQITYYTILFLSFFILLQTTIPFKKRIQIVILYIIFSLAISSFQLIPFFEYVFRANRASGNLGYALSGSLELPQLITTFFPTFFGAHLNGTWWGSQITLVGYIGVAGLLFLLIGILHGKFENKKTYLFLFVISIVLALGKWGGMYFLFYYLIPGWSSLRSPVELLVLTTFFASIFAAHGYNYVFDHLSRFSILGRKMIYLTTPVVIILGFLLFISFHRFSWDKLFSTLSLWHVPLVSRFLFYSDTKIQTICIGIIENIFLFSLFFLFASFALWKLFRFPLILMSFFLILISIDLFVADQTSLQLAPLSYYSPSSLQTIQQLQDAQYRIFSNPVTLDQDKRFLPGPDFFYKEAKLNLTEITDNHVIPLHVYSISGYTSLVPRTYAQFMDSINITGISPSEVTQNMLNETAVHFILNVNKGGKLAIKNNFQALPRARLLKNNKNNMVSIVGQPNPNRVIIRISSKTPNILILADTYYPGWKAYIKNHEVIIDTYKHAFRQIPVSQGSSTIVFVYDPISWKIGLLISGVSFVFLLLFSKVKKKI